jgi:hypothetical protein
MKTTLKRTLLVMLFATSISAFAKSGDGKRDHAATSTKVTQQDRCNPNPNNALKPDEQKSADQQKIKQQDEEWLHDLQGIYGE